MSVEKRALFICLGNICRSPIAEGVFTKLIKERGIESKWKVDSAAVGGWHVGKSPDPRARDVLKENNIPYNNTARKIVADDFRKFDYIFGMDNANMGDLLRLAPDNSKAKLLLLGEFDPDGEKIIRDPYYDSDDAGFKKCYQQCMRSLSAFLDKVEKGEI